MCDGSLQFNSGTQYIFLQWIFYHEGINIISNSDSDLSDNDEEIFFYEGINDQVIASPKTTTNAKVIRAMKKLQAS